MISNAVLFEYFIFIFIKLHDSSSQQNININSGAQATVDSSELAAQQS